MDHIAPGTVVDRYQVVEVLGEGAMGVVYRVRHTQLGSDHALKVVGVDNRRLVARLVREGRLQAGLRHPHIVAVTDAVEVDGRPGLVMELVEGCTLEQWLAAHPDATRARRLELVRQVVEAVGYAHGQRTIHRDLKPANILVSEGTGRPLAKVADFGLAKWLADEGDGDATRAGIAMGTPRYMAPEQFVDARSVDERADVFALGCILLEVVTGRPAYPGETIPEIHRNILAGPPRLPADLSPGLAAVIGRALRTDREERLPSCAALLAALDEAETGVAPPPRPRWLPVLVGAGGAASLAAAASAALLASAGAVAVAWWWLTSPAEAPSPIPEPPATPPGHAAPADPPADPPAGEAPSPPRVVPRDPTPERPPPDEGREPDRDPGKGGDKGPDRERGKDKDKDKKGPKGKAP